MSINYASSASVSAAVQLHTQTEISRVAPLPVQLPLAIGMISISMLAPRKPFTTALQAPTLIAIWSSSSTLLTFRCPVSTITSRSSTMRMHLVSFDTYISKRRTVVRQRRSVLKVRWSSIFHFFGGTDLIEFLASGSGASVTYSVNAANTVPTGSASTSSPTLTLTVNTNTNTMTSSGWEDWTFQKRHYCPSIFSPHLSGFICLWLTRLVRSAVGAAREMEKRPASRMNDSRETWTHIIHLINKRNHPHLLDVHAPTR